MTEQTQLAKISEGGLSLSDMFQGMLELAKDPDVDPAKMEAMLTMQERMIDRQAKQEYQTAMHAARSEMPRITKDGKIEAKGGRIQSRYSTYENIDKIVRPLVEGHGLTYGFDFKEGEQGRMLVTCIVSHTGGHEERFGPMPLSIDTTGAKNATQGAGSAGSYGQRYTLCAAFNIVTVGSDDDGGGQRGQLAAPEDWQGELVDAGRTAAGEGIKAYEAWFKGLSGMQRGWLVDEGHHATNKDAAAHHDNS